MCLYKTFKNYLKMNKNFFDKNIMNYNEFCISYFKYLS